MYEFFRKMRPTNIVLDTGKAGIWMFDYMNSKAIYPYGVGSTWWNVINNPSPRLYNIANTILEWNLKNIMNTGIIKWYSWLDYIRNEYETFEASKTRQWTNHHHDILSSLMIWITIALERNRLSFRAEKKQVEENEEEVMDWFWAKQQNTQWTSKFMY
jgi:hypothetical protein